MRLSSIKWVYVPSEPGLFTVGWEDTSGKWHPESDHESREAAAKRVMVLNGDADPCDELRAENERLAMELSNSRAATTGFRMDADQANKRAEAAEAEVEWLRAALEKIANTEGDIHPSWHVQTAREALGRAKPR